MACKQQMTLEFFCKLNQGACKPPKLAEEDKIACCMAMTPGCLACS
jgi:hypothetical protein